MTKATIAQQAAAEVMYTYFRNNRVVMPPNITTQRDFILTSLVAGMPVADAFAIAIARASQLITIKPLKQHKIVVSKGTNQAA